MAELGRSFSVDSLGDSTRSLLSPLCRSLSPEADLSEGPLDDSSEEEGNQKKSFEGLHEDKYPQSQPKTKSNGSSSRNFKSAYSYDSTFCYDDSKSSRRSRTVKSARSSSSHTSRRSLSALDNRRTVSDENTNKRLSSWEEWLVRKTLQDREKVKAQKLQKRKEKEESEKKKRDEEEKARKAAEVRAAWVEEKNKIEMEKRRKKREDMDFARRQKEEQQQVTELKSRENFRKWSQEKREKILESSRQEEENARMRKDKEIERRLKNEQAFTEWLERLKSRPKPVYGSFGYTSGKLTGFYEWGTYPAPSYINPVPWVPPKLHKNNRQKGKQQAQPPSPPLLFKELEQRMLRKKKGSHSQNDVRQAGRGRSPVNR